MVGSRIRHFRVNQGMKLKELCQGICSVSQLSKIETGKAVGTEQQLRALAMRLGVTFQLLQGDDGAILQQEVEEQMRVARKASSLKKPEQALKIIHRLRQRLDSEQHRGLWLRVVLLQAQINEYFQRWNEVVETLQEVLPYEQTADLSERLEFLGRLARACVSTKQVEQGLRYGRKFAEALEELSDQNPQFMMLHHMNSNLTFLMGDFRESYRSADLSFQKSLEGRPVEWRVSCQSRVATALTKLGEWDEAIAHFHEVVRDASANLLVFHEALHLTNLGHAYLLLERLPEAREALTKSLDRMELASDETSGFLSCVPYLIYAKYLVCAGEYQAAEEYLTRVDQMMVSLEQGATYISQGMAYEIRAESACLQRKLPEQIRNLREALALYEHHQSPREAFERASELGDVLAEQGDPEALEMYRLALQHAHRYDAIFSE